MLLTLRPADVAQRPTCAALLRGPDPAAWLREISRWGVPASRLRCYLVPESIQSVAVAGLLVVAEGSGLPADVLEPYGVEAGRLYVPVRAVLWPATTAAELAAALLWPRQLLRPGGELVGFDTADELDVGSLLHLPPPGPADWSRARPAPAPLPPLRRLRVAAPSAADVVQQLQATVAPAPLAELPGLAESRPGPGRRLLGGLHRALLRVALAAARLGAGAGRSHPAAQPEVGNPWQQLVGGLLLLAGMMLALALLLAGRLATAGLVLMGLLTLVLLLKMREAAPPSPAAQPAPPPAGPGAAGRAEASPARPGWRRRAESWLGRRLDDLEKQRQTELQRLLKLFQENPAEALRYAIPLDSPYLGRGTAAPGARLGRREQLNFDLGRLGGGQATDAWDVGSYASDLRTQYLAAARHETAAGRHRQAAYILAHLLADYRAAAQLLTEGRHFREAAALYRDHLHDPPAAARCLEQGGLLLEAADLYATLGEPEKAGDLHQQLDQPAQAARYYEQATATLLANHDHPEAARVLAAKLADPARAQATLLQGWDDNRQPALCLQRYFELAAAQPEADLPARVQALYRQHTPPARRGALLQVLGQVVAAHPAALPAAREVAYHAIGQETAAGNFAHLPLLRPFVPTDPLLPGDLSRFGSRQPRRPVPAPTTPCLDATIAWHSAVSYRQQWLAVGVRDGHLHLARGNWHGQIGYYSWTSALPAGAHLQLVADEHHSARVLLRCDNPPGFVRRVLPATDQFADTLTLEFPSCLPPYPAPVALLPADQLASAEVQADTLVLKQYAPHGQLAHTRTVAGAPPRLSLEGIGNWSTELLYDEGRFYFACNAQLVCLAGDDDYQLLDAGSLVYNLVRSPYPGPLLLAAVTDDDVLLWEPTRPDAEPHRAALPSLLRGGAWLRFVAPGYLLVCDGKHASLYRAAGPQLELVRELTPAPEAWIAALPTSHHRHFALLTGTGRLTLHSLDEDEPQRGSVG